MTSGSPGKLILTFAIPLMLGNIFQQLYTIADTMIVGRVIGVEALAAVGAADWLVWLVFGSYIFVCVPICNPGTGKYLDSSCQWNC